MSAIHQPHPLLQVGVTLAGSQTPCNPTLRGTKGIVVGGRFVAANWSEAPRAGASRVLSATPGFESDPRGSMMGSHCRMNGNGGPGVLAHLTTDKGEAIPITPVTRDGFAAWLVGAAEAERNWLLSTGFAAEPGKVGLLPGPGGRLARVLVGVVPDEPLWSLGALPDTPPEGLHAPDAAG